MRFLPCLVSGVIALISTSGNCPAMGSGPHPNVPFGIPQAPAHFSPGPDLNQPASAADDLPPFAASLWVLPIFMLMPSILLISAKLLIWTLQKNEKK